MSSLKMLALSAAAAALLAPVMASAQEEREEITVTAPRLHITQEGRDLRGPQRYSMSQDVSYSDLDLRSRRDQRELRMRVRDAARDICDRLNEYGPRPSASEPSCYRAAVDSGMLRVDAAIMNVRNDGYVRAGYRHHR